MKIVIRGVLVGLLLYLSGFSIVQGVDRTVYALDHMRASEEEMRARVSSTPGAIGYISKGGSSFLRPAIPMRIASMKGPIK